MIRLVLVNSLGLKSRIVERVSLLTRRRNHLLTGPTPIAVGGGMGETYQQSVFHFIYMYITWQHMIAQRTCSVSIRQ